MIKYILLILLCTAPVLAQNNSKQQNIHRQPQPAAETDDEQYTWGPLAGCASIFPGIVLHGSGLYVTGDKETAKDLMLIEAVSFGVFAGSSVYYGLTGASRKVSWPMVTLIGTSGTAFILTWFADLYGTNLGIMRSSPGTYSKNNRYIKPFAGHVGIDDKQFEYSSFMYSGLEFKFDAVFFRCEIWKATDDDNNRYLLDTAYDIIGKNGVFLHKYKEILTLSPHFRAGYHNFSDYGFTKKWIDISARARVIPGNIWNSLRGSFCYFEWGYNHEWVTFDFGNTAPVLKTDQLLFVAGFGVQLGNLAAPLGECSVYYNHRRDDFTGGINGGFLGYIGLQTEFYITDMLSFTLDYSYGSAAVINTHCSLIF